MNRAGKPSVVSVLRRTLEVVWWLWIGIGVLVAADTLIGITSSPLNVRLDLLVPFALDPTSFHVTSPRLGVDEVHIGDAFGKMVFSTANPVLIVTWIGWFCLWMGGWLVVIHQLRATFRTIESGDPFAGKAALRIRMIGLVILVMEAAQWVLLLCQQWYLNSQFSTVGLSFRTLVRPNLELVFLGLAVLVIAEVFRTGKSLRDEQALTV